MEKQRTLKDALGAVWACLTCYTKNPFGKFEAGDVGSGEGMLVCPICRSDDIAPADGQVRETDHQPVVYGELH